MCEILNFRPNGRNVSSAEYIVKPSTNIQSYGLPSGLYGFIDNQDAEVDISKRIRSGEVLSTHMINKGFVLSTNTFDDISDDQDNPITQEGLFTRFSIGLFKMCLHDLGVKKLSNYDDTSMENVMLYGQRLGFSENAIQKAYSKFKYDWNNANNGNLLWSPITYVLKYDGYDGVCNLASNKNSGGSILLQDIEPRGRGVLGGNGLISALGVKKRKKSMKKVRKHKKVKSMKKVRKHNPRCSN